MKSTKFMILTYTIYLRCLMWVLFLRLHQCCHSRYYV